MSQPLLQVQNLSINFIADNAVTNAVKDISFSVAAGEIVAIVGESGSGKSVTALALMRLLPPQAKIAARLLFSSKENSVFDLLTISPKQINAVRGKDIAMIFQEPMTSLNPVLTCGYQVMEAIQLHQQVSLKMAKEKAIILFEKVALPNPAEIINRYPHQLSGGQKQRVMIAMAMSCNPSLLIADEPTTALDVTVQKSILQLIKNLQQQTGMGVIFITHDLGLVADIADRVLVMYKGQILEQGKTKEVLQNPQQAYTKALLTCRPSMHKRGERLPVVNDFFNSLPAFFSSSPIDNSIVKDMAERTGEAKKIEPAPMLTDNNSGPQNSDKNPGIILQVEKLKVYYPGKRSFFPGKIGTSFKAVDDVSFTVYKGETLGLVGESGCGKTTLAEQFYNSLQLLRAILFWREKTLRHFLKNNCSRCEKNCR